MDFPQLMELKRETLFSIKNKWIGDREGWWSDGVSGRGT